MIAAGLLAGRNPALADEHRRVPAAAVQRSRDAARVCGHGEVGRLLGPVHRRVPRGIQPDRAGRGGVAALPEPTTPSCCSCKPRSEAGRCSVSRPGPTTTGSSTRAARRTISRKRSSRPTPAPTGQLTLIGLDTHARDLNVASAEPPGSYSIGGLPPTTAFTLVVWNAAGDGTNTIAGSVTSSAAGVARFTVPPAGSVRAYDRAGLVRLSGRGRGARPASYPAVVSFA